MGKTVIAQTDQYHNDIGTLASHLEAGICIEEALIPQIPCSTLAP